jgi:hypothetical protein
MEEQELSLIREICGTAPNTNIFKNRDADDDYCSWQSVYRANMVEVV